MEKQILFISTLCIAVFTMSGSACAQAFNKGSLLVSISEGSTHTKYTSVNTEANNGTVSNHVNGDRDPLTVEYGLSKHFGIGLNMGGDILHADPKSFYNINSSGKAPDVITSELTVDATYHYFITRRTDLSGFLSAGPSSVYIKGKDGDANYTYNAGGGLVRVGTKAKYYFCRHFGIMGMLSAYGASCSPKGVKDNTVAAGYDTRITGYASEFGICGRFLR